MKHPNREQWIGFLYDDCEAAEKSELASHLNSCATCRQQLDTWRHTTAVLDTYKIERRAQPSWQTVPWLRWSTAAAILLAAGISIGAAISPRANPVEAKVISDLQARVEKSETEAARTQRLLLEFSKNMAANRAEDQAALLATAQQLQATRKDLETVAALTEVSLKSIRLAGYSSSSE
jgi:hypothetical protein